MDKPIKPYTMNPHHQTFINEMILHNDAVRAYKAAYPNARGEAARTAAHRLMKKPDIRQLIADAYKQLRLGIREDKTAFLHNELKIIDRKRKMLLEIMFSANEVTPRQRMMAMKLDNELATQQAHLLGYGSLKPGHNRHNEQPHQGCYLERSERYPGHIGKAKATPVLSQDGIVPCNDEARNTETVTNSNINKPTHPSLRGSICEGKYVRSNLTATGASPALVQDCFIPHNDEARNTEILTNRNIPKAPLTSLRGNICEGKYVRSNLTATGATPALVQDCFISHNDEARNTETLTNRSIPKAPLTSLRGSICEGKYVRSNLTATGATPVLIRDSIVPHNDEARNTETLTNRNIPKAPLTSLRGNICEGKYVRSNLTATGATPALVQDCFIPHNDEVGKCIAY